jgi:hypothetical protein
MCLSRFSVTVYFPWLVGDASSIAFPCIHTLASCIPSRYARCTTWRTWCGANPKMVLVDPPRRWKDRTSARMGDAHQASFIWQTINPPRRWKDRTSARMGDAHQASFIRIPGKPWSIIRLPTFQSKNYIYVICIVALRIGVGWKPCCIDITPCLDIWTWILCRTGSYLCLAMLS